MQTQLLTIDAYNLFHQGTLALARAERQGMRVDVEYCETQTAHLSRQIRRIQEKLDNSAFMKEWKRRYYKRFNFNSPDQLADMLYNYSEVKPIAYTDGKCNRCKGKGEVKVKGKEKPDECPICWGTGNNPSINEESLEATGVPEVVDIIKIRKLNKIKDTYLAAFLREQVDGVVHQMFNLNIARSFRPSTEAPNLANVPKRDPFSQKLCRKALYPRKGHKILSADFKGIEVGISACYNHDPRLIEYVSDKTKDMHRDMAMELYLLKQAQITKAIRHSGKNEFVFPEFYGDYYGNCAENLWISAHKDTHILSDGTPLIQHLAQKGITNQGEFVAHVEAVERDFWERRFKVYTKWKKEWLKEYWDQGYFDLLTGFRCSGVMEKNQVTNYPVQGSAFHCLLQCLIWIDEDSIKERWDSRVCNQIYDALMVDVHPKEEQMVMDRMKMYMTERLPEYWPWIIVPLEIDFEIGPVDGSWYEAK